MLIVDGKPVPAAGTLLDACRAAGADVPAFCHDPRLPVGGHCRACMVEVGGRLVPSCHTPARDGLVVLTDTPRIRAHRHELGELMLAESRPEGWVGRVLASWGCTGETYGRATPGTRRKDRSHPYLRIDLDKCILCRRCVRACASVQGQFVWHVYERGGRSEVGWGDGAFAESDCVSCGACVQTCPTDAISDRDRERHPAPPGPPVRTTCGYCGVGCQLDVYVQDGEIARVHGADAKVNRGHLCVKGRYAHGFATHPERLTTPLIRRDGQLVPCSWGEALDAVAAGLARNAGRIAGLSSSRCTNEENYLFQKWMRGGLGTNDVDSCARVCHAPSAAGMRVALGTGAATNSLEDVERASLLMVVGANATEAHPVTGARIKQAALSGATLVVIDPRRIELAEYADVHLQPRPGTNVPLLNSFASVLVEEGLVDMDFVAARTEGWEALVPALLGETPEKNEAITGVPAALVRKAARLYAAAARPMMVHGLGMTEHFQGSEGVMLLCNLALLRGAIGREGVGVNPLRGQNNVQGAADMGCQPDSTVGYQPVADPAVRARIAAVWGRPLPETPGRRLDQMLDAARRGEVTAMAILGEDVVQTDPDTAAVREALGALDFLVVQELFLSETAKLAHVVLPGASVFEKDGTFTNGERRIQRVRQALPPRSGRADWETLCALMAATGWTQAYPHPGAIMDEIATVAPLFAGVHYERLDGDGLQWPVPGAAHPGTPRLHAESFPHGRGRLSVVPYVPSPGGAGAGYRLVTGRVLEHYNCGTMTRRTPNVDLHAADLLEIHPRDADAEGIADGAAVEVRSDVGVARAVARVTSRVAPGTLFLTFHFPETGANLLTGDVRDRVTGCPEYKLTTVRVRPAP